MERTARDKRADIPFIDVVRALAPVFVMWAHLGPWWCQEHASTCSADGTVWAPVAITRRVADRLPLNGNGGHLGVLLFFLVSGFIISHVVHFENRMDFVIKRVFRLVPMLIVASAFAYAVSSALMAWGLPPILGFSARSLTDLFLSMFLLNTFIPSPYTLLVSWSLVPEVGFYILMTAAWSPLKRWPLGGTYLLIAVVAIVDLVTISIFSFKPAHYFFIQVEFILVGRAVYLNWAGLVKRWSAALLAATALATLAGVDLTQPYSRLELLGAQSVMVSWAIAVVVFAAMISVRRCPAPLRLLGNSSYSLYLMHIPLGCLVLSVLSLQDGLPYKLAFPIALVVIFTTSYLTYRLVEVPGQKLGRLIIARRRAVRVTKPTWPEFVPALAPRGAEATDINNGPGKAQGTTR